MTDLHCTICTTPLTGGLDTYGDVGAELCIDCWYDLPEQLEPDSWYGMAPHHHDLERTGSYIGSTVFDPLPEPDANGVYKVGSLYFVPDEEVGGDQGVWYKAYPGEQREGGE